MRPFLRFLIICSLFITPLCADAQLVPKFGATVDSGCGPLTVQFIDSTTGGTVTTYNWTVFFHMGSGTTAVFTSSSPSPIHTFTATGFYDVEETVTSGTVTATVEYVNFLHVFEPNVSFQPSNLPSDTALSCPIKTVTFVNTTTDTGCVNQYKWVILNSVTGPVATFYTTGTGESVTYTFNTPGYYNIELFVNSSPCGCGGGYVINDSLIKIDVPPAISFFNTNPNACGAPDTVSFNSDSTVGAVTFQWNFGGGGTSSLPDPVHVYTAPGIYNDTLTAYSAGGCPANVHHLSDVTVGNFVPSFYSVVSMPYCRPNFGYSFTDITPGANGWLWRASGTTFSSSSHGFSEFFPGPGIYTITDSTWSTITGCSGVVSHTYTFNPVPVVSFIATPAYRCTPNDTVSFTHTVIDASGIDSIAWAFGDPLSGHFDTAYSDSIHIYTTAGYFTPRLYVKDNNGCVTIDSTQLNYIGIHPPTASIIPNTTDSGCAPFVYCYHTAVNPSSATLITDSVSYGDGTPHCIGPDCGDTCHTYITGGIFKIRHYYHLLEGCYYSDSINVVIGTTHPIMSSYASPDSVCPNSEVYFFDNCSNCTSFHWNLANKTSNSMTEDSSSYTTLGPVPIVAIGDVNGCTDTLTPTLYILPPLANIMDLVHDCSSPNVISFYNSGSTGAASFHWSFGDGTTSTLPNPTHAYTVPLAGETYTVTLVDTAGTLHQCTNIATKIIDIYPIIDTFSADDTSVCRLVNVLFTGPIPQLGGAYSQYIWTFSSAGSAPVTETSTSPAYSYAFSDTGIFDVQLVVVNSYGCSDTLIKHGYIHVTGPVGGITATDPVVGCAPLTVHFHDNNSVVAGSSIIYRIWQFSGPTSVAGVPNRLDTGYAADTSYTFPEGSFRIVLIDTDNNHCFSYDSIRVHSEKPHAFFTATSTVSCRGIPVNFHDTNTHCTYLWNFGDGTIGTGQSPSHIYTANGTYSVSVSIITTASSYLPLGCVDTFKRLSYITINDISAAFNFITDSISICPPLLVQANASGVLPGYHYYWDIDHASPYYTGSFFSNNFTVAGIHTLTLFDSTASGCRDSASSTVEIDGPAGIVTVVPDSGCIPLSVHLHFIDTNGTAVVPNFTWITGDAVYNSIDTPGIIHIYTTAGVYNPSVIISSPGCSVTINSTDSVNVFPLPAATVTQPAIICYGTSAVLTAGGATTGDNYSWAPSTGLSCTTCTSVTVSPTLTTTYTVTLTNIHGCIDTALSTVAVDSQLAVFVAGKDSVCLGQCDTLRAYGVAGNYLWTPDTALSAATHDTVIACPFITRIYTVTATDNRGCSASATFELTVLPLPDIQISPANPYVCKGDSTQLFASGAGPGGVYVWSPDKFISDTTIYDPFVKDTSFFTYKVVGTSSFGCVDSNIAVNVVVYDSAHTSISNDTLICAGKTVQLVATCGPSGYPVTYLWSPPDGLDNADIADPMATPAATTVYTVTIVENPCYTVKRDATVSVEPLPVINVSGGTTIIAGDTVQLSAAVGNADTIFSWAWTPGNTLSCDTCADPVATPTNTTTYTVTGTTRIGCPGENDVLIKVICVEASQVFVPNTFTPNGDGANDRFYMSGKGLGLIRKMTVYNRWGEQVFETENINANDPGAGWDGTYKGQILQPDVFVYVFELYCETGVPFTLKGDISLVR